jgi:hypothetical protein
LVLAPLDLLFVAILAQPVGSVTRLACRFSLLPLAVITVTGLVGSRVTALACLFLLSALAVSVARRPLGSGRPYQYHFAFLVSHLRAPGLLRRVDFHDTVYLYRPFGDHLHVFHIDAAIDNAIVNDRNVRHVLCLAHQLDVTRGRGVVGTQTWGKNVAFLHKGKPLWGNIYTNVGGAKANTHMKTDLRRQGGPANPARGATPAYPGWPPDGAGHPEPAVGRVI